MKELTVPIDQAGRIVLPKGVREELAIKPGDILSVAVHGKSVTLTPNKESTGFIRKGKALIFTTALSAKMTNDGVNELLEEMRAERHGEPTSAGQTRKRR